MSNLSLDMDSNALRDWIADNGPVHVVFNAKAQDKDSYPENGIQGIVTVVLDRNQDVYKWEIDYTRFEVLNSLYESKNYYGSAIPVSKAEKRSAYLSAYATAFYKRKDVLYVEPNDRIGDILHSIQPASALGVSPDAVEQRFAALQKELGLFSI